MWWPGGPGTDRVLTSMSQHWLMITKHTVCNTITYHCWTPCMMDTVEMSMLTVPLVDGDWRWMVMVHCTGAAPGTLHTLAPLVRAHWHLITVVVAAGWTPVSVSGSRYSPVSTVSTVSSSVSPVSPLQWDDSHNTWPCQHRPMLLQIWQRSTKK